MDLHLVKRRLHHFNGVLDGADVQFRRGDLSKGGIEGRGLAGTGGPGDQHDAVRLAGDRLPALPVFPTEPQLLVGLQQNVRVEDPHHHLLAKGRGQGGQPQFHLAVVWLAGLDAAVLGPAFLRHVQPP